VFGARHSTYQEQENVCYEVTSRISSYIFLWVRYPMDECRQMAMKCGMDMDTLARRLDRFAFLDVIWTGGVYTISIGVCM